MDLFRKLEGDICGEGAYPNEIEAGLSAKQLMKYIMSNEAKAHNMDILVQVHMCVHNGPGVHMHVEERGVLCPNGPFFLQQVGDDPKNVQKILHACPLNKVGCLPDSTGVNAECHRVN